MLTPSVTLNVIIHLQPKRRLAQIIKFFALDTSINATSELTPSTLSSQLEFDHECKHLVEFEPSPSSRKQLIEFEPSPSTRKQLIEFEPSPSTRKQPEF
jgi:hypothetical protein